MEEILKKLRQVGVSESTMARFEDRFADRSVGDDDWSYWSSLVDESDYGWREWVEAVLILDERVSADGSVQSPPYLRGLLGYVSCTAEGARGSGILDPLPERVDEAFQTYGFAGSD